MKTLLLFLLISTSVFSQQLVGVSYSDVVKNYDVKLTYAEDGSTYLSLTEKNYYAFYFFNDDNICWCTLIYPRSLDSMYALIEVLNDHYIVVSDTEWKMYSNGVVVNAMLIRDDDNQYVLSCMSKDIGY